MDMNSTSSIHRREHVFAKSFEQHMLSFRTRFYKPVQHFPDIDFRYSYEPADRWSSIETRWEHPDCFRFSNTSDDRQLFLIAKFRGGNNIWGYDSRLEYDPLCQECLLRLDEYRSRQRRPTSNSNVPLPPSYSEATGGEGRLKRPCYDVLRDLGKFKGLDDILAFWGPKTKKICYRDDWCWETLSKLHDENGYVEAVYDDPDIYKSKPRLWKIICFLLRVFCLNSRQIYLSDLPAEVQTGRSPRSH